MKKILVLHGPNLNLLGSREPEIYGTTSLDELNHLLIQQAKKANLSLRTHQTNSESELINFIQAAKAEEVDFIVLNPAALTHTSLALRDALLAVAIPFIEVHLTNVYARESFRHHSYLSDIAQGLIIGLGIKSYTLALQYIISELT